MKKRAKKTDPQGEYNIWLNCPSFHIRTPPNRGISKFWWISTPKEAGLVRYIHLLERDSHWNPFFASQDHRRWRDFARPTAAIIYSHTVILNPSANGWRISAGGRLTIRLLSITIKLRVSVRDSSSSRWIGIPQNDSACGLSGSCRMTAQISSYWVRTSPTNAWRESQTEVRNETKYQGILRL